MSYQVQIGNKIIKDAFYALSPVTWLLRIFALKTVKRHQNKLVESWSWVSFFGVLTIMIIINISCLVIKINRFQGNHGEIMFTDSLQLTYLLGFTEYIVDLIFVYKMRYCCVKYFNFYTCIDKVLGMPKFSEIKTKNLKAVVFVIVVFTVSSIFDYFSWSFAYTWDVPALYLLDYLYGFINALTIVDVVSNIMQIEYRIKLILARIEELYTSSSSLHGELEIIDYATFERKKLANIKLMSYSTGFGISSLNKSYVMLLEQVNYINAAYGIRLGAFCLNIFIYLICLVNIIIRIILGQFSLPRIAQHLTMASTILRTINFCMIFLALVYHCEQTYKLCSAIIRVIDLTIVSKKIPSELKTSLQDLRTLILSRPVRFHGANFFSLEYPLLVSVASVVITYSIILLQSMR